MGLHRQSVPTIAWLSLLSLDAVAVAVTWQAMLVVSFLNRWPVWSESLALGSTVWLIYVADRLLDGSRLDISRPHTLRHRFYHDHAKLLIAGWVIVLTVVSMVVFTQLSFDLIRWGLLLAAAVLIYGAGVHFVPTSRRDDVEMLGKQTSKTSNRRSRVPKEVQVGLLFSLGVSLVVWPETYDAWSQIQLVLTTLVAAILFTTNCFLVSYWEQELDRAQSFAVTQVSQPTGRVYLALIIALIAMPIIGVVAKLPTALVAAFACCSLAMFWTINRNDQVISVAQASPDEQTVYFDVRGIVIDASLWIPTVLVLMFQ